MKDLINTCYWYFTDFCLNAANLLGITYVEFNFWLFVVLFPSILLLLLLLNVSKFLISKKRKKRIIQKEPVR